MLKEAIILAGGQGTRLQSVVSGIPKPMAPIGTTPFLTYLLDQCNQFNITHIVLAVGYKHEKISDYYGNKYKNIAISYAIEKDKLGTGGAIFNALQLCKSNDILILNGDSILNLDILSFYKKHKVDNALFSIALKPMVDFDRYGSVVSKNGKVIQFNEKQFCKEGLINSGVYIANRNALMQEPFEKKFSFETEFLSQYVNKWEFSAFESNTFFIDIGIPEDYKNAQELLKKEF